MPSRAGRRPALAAALVVGTLVVAGCTGGPGDTSDAPSTTPPTSATGTPTPTATAAEDEATGEVAAVRTVPVDGGLMQVDVHPLVRAEGPPGVGELVVLTLDLSVAELPAGAPELRTTLVFSDDDTSGSNRGDVGLVRLLDLREGRAHLLARDAEGRGVATGAIYRWDSLEPGSSARVQAVYAAPPADVEDVAVLLPRTGLVDALPVVDGPVPAPSTEPGTDADADADAEPLDLTTVADAATPALEAYTEGLEGAVRSDETAEAVQVDLASDVLFERDSADLTPAAADVVRRAAETVLAREPGPLTVVGHTDDRADDAYNLDLSLRRARAVADALAPSLGPDRPLSVEGRGESQPAYPGTSEEARERNRRVELSLTAPRASPADDGPADLPPAPELTAPADEGVVVTQVGGWSFDIGVADARRLHDHVVVELEVEALPYADDPDAELSLISLGTLRDPRDFDVTNTGLTSARGMVLLQGTTAVFPLFSAWGEGSSPRVCACAPRVTGGLAQGQVMTATLVYPPVPGDELVVQNTAVTSADASFRLTDVRPG